jgi:chemotaxis protein MotB
LYRSNWDLSSQRAVAVAEELRRAEGFNEARMSVVGKADTAPLEAENDSIQSRSRNRRVEIAINQGKPKISDPISVLE